MRGIQYGPRRLLSTAALVFYLDHPHSRMMTGVCDMSDLADLVSRLFPPNGSTPPRAAFFARVGGKGPAAIMLLHGFFPRRT